MAGRPIAPRSPVMLALDILEGRVKAKPAPRARKETKQDAPRKPSAKKNWRRKAQR